MNKLSKYIEKENLIIIEDDIPINNLKGLYFDGTIVIDSKIDTSTEKICILAEEIGHHYTTSGNIIDLKDVNNIKQESRARDWAYEKLIGIIDLINAYKAGVRSRYELAEFLDVTEEFLDKSIDYYKRKYGLLFRVDNYVVYFEPLSVLEMLE